MGIDASLTSLADLAYFYFYSLILLAITHCGSETVSFSFGLSRYDDGFVVVYSIGFSAGFSTSLEDCDLASLAFLSVTHLGSQLSAGFY